MNRKMLIIAAVTALAIVGLALAMVPKGAAPGSLPPSGDVTNQQLRDAVAGGARLVDVRTAAEYAGGHIAGAENVPIDAVPTEAGAWDKAEPIALYCATGARSLNAYEFLKAQGFAKVYNLAQGVAAWDGEVVTGTTSGAKGTFAATGKPTLYDFFTSG